MFMKTIERVNSLWEAQLQIGIKETQFIIKNSFAEKERRIFGGEIREK